MSLTRRHPSACVAAIVPWIFIMVLAGMAQGVRAQRVKSAWDGIYMDDQAARGETRFLESCAGCHGTDAAGTEMAPALAGGAFTAKWDGRSTASLFELMRTTMPLNMPGGFSRQQNAELLSFILKKNGFPVGRVPLPSDSGALQDVPVLSKKP